MHDFFKKNTFIRVISCVIITSIFVCILTGLLISYYSNSVLKNYQFNSIDNYQLNALRGIENYSHQLPKVIMQILDDNDISKFLRDNSPTEVKKDIVTRKMSTYMFYYSINSIKIIHQKSNSIWCDTDMTRLDLDKYLEQDSSIIEVMNLFNEGYNFINGNNLSNKNDGIYYTYFNFQGYTFVLNLNVDDYRESVLLNFSPFACETWIYCKGLLTLTDSKSTMDAVKKYDIDISSISSTSNFKSGNILFVARHSDDYTAITAIPYTDFQRETKKSVSTLFVITFIIVILCGISLLLYLRYIHIMKDVYNEKIDEAQTKLEKGTWQNIMYKLFAGLDIKQEEKDIIEKIMNDPNCKYYVPALVLLDDSHKLLLINSELRMVKLNISSIIQQVIGDEFICHTVSIEKGRIGVILCFSHKEFYDEIFNKVKKSSEIIKSETDTTVSWVIGREYTDISLLSDNILELFKSAQYCFISDSESVIRSTDINKIDDAAYPIDIEQKMVIALKRKDDQEFNNACIEFIDYIKAHNYLIGRKWGLYLYTNIMSVFCSGNEVPYIPEHSLSSFDNIHELFRAIKTYVDSINDNQCDDFKVNAQRFISDNYSDNDCCLADFAQSFGISSVYAGQKFKKSFNMTFNTYLAQYRCQRAVELLINTNKRSVEISVLCGFKSDTYYNYIFKKYMKITPQQYRKAYKKID